MQDWPWLLRGARNLEKSRTFSTRSEKLCEIGIAFSSYRDG